MAILTIEGITAMQLASLITLSGIALSGVAMISVRTRAEASIRFSISDVSLSSSVSFATDHAIPANNARLDMSTTKLLSDLARNFVIRRPLLPCSMRAVVLNDMGELSLRVVAVPSGSACKVIGTRLHD